MRPVYWLSAAIACAMVASTAHAGAGDLLYKIEPSDGALSDLFGQSVAANSSVTLIGSPFDDDVGFATGSAYLFDLATGTEVAKFTSDDVMTGDQFGSSVALNSDTALIGTSFGEAAYLFDLSTHAQLAKLTVDDSLGSSGFGRSVALSDQTAVIGAPLDDDTGTAYLFDIASKQQLAELAPSDPELGAVFGASVAISGNTAIVGAPFTSDNGLYSGAAYLFDVDTGTQLAKLLPDDGEADGRFGSSVAIVGNVALVGAHGQDASIGAAYLFDATTGQQLAKLVPSDLLTDTRFGYTVTLDANTALIAAKSGDFGAAYMFDLSSGMEIAKFTAPDMKSVGGTRGNLALSGNTAVLGASMAGYGGSAYVFDATRVPEPTSAVLVLLGVACMGLCRTRRLSR